MHHALRAFTARDRKPLRAAAETCRDTPRLDLTEAITEVGTGEAATSFLERKGVPGMAERTLIRPPGSRLGPVTPAERAAVLAGSPVVGKYDVPLDHESAAEILAARSRAAAAEGHAAGATDAAAEEEREFNAACRYSGARPGSGTSRPARRSSRSDSVGEVFAKSFARQLGTQTGRALMRGVLGGLFRGP